MQACCSTEFRGIDGNEDAASRDLKLVAAARAGSNAAFEELQNRYSRRLYRRIQSITRDHEDSEDALQETFLRAYVALDSFGRRSPFASWLTKIRHQFRTDGPTRPPQASRGLFSTLPESGEPASTIDVRDTALNPEQLCALRQRSYCASHAISQLNINLRAPMNSWIEQECSMKEVARTLGFSLPAVKARPIVRVKSLAALRRSNSAF